MGVLLVGGLGLTAVAYDYLDRVMFQTRLRGQIEVAREAEFVSHVTETADDATRTRSEATATRAAAISSGLIGEIRIERLDLTAMVAEGTDPKTLRRAVGHLPETAYPGEAGNAVLAGHRDSFFRGLKDIRDGDRIVVDTPDGSFHYMVVGTTVVPPEDVGALEPTTDPILTLVTCYPFSYIGPAPERFVVVAEQVLLGGEVHL